MQNAKLRGSFASEYYKLLGTVNVLRSFSLYLQSVVNAFMRIVFVVVKLHNFDLLELCIPTNVKICQKFLQKNLLTFEIFDIYK